MGQEQVTATAATTRSPDVHVTSPPGGLGDREAEGKTVSLPPLPSLASSACDSERAAAAAAVAGQIGASVESRRAGIDLELRL